MAAANVPLFSLSELQNRLRQDELRKCLMEKGIFYLTEYGVSEAMHQLARTTAMDFFEKATEEEKAALINGIPGIRRGYSKLESESTASITNSGHYSDYSMCYSMGMNGNLFPSLEYEKLWTDYFNQLYQATKETAKEVLNVIEADCKESVDSFLECDPVLRFRYFPEVPEHRCAEFQPLRMASHYDISIVTIIHQTPCSNGFVSLQYEDNGNFVDLPPVPNSVIVMCGAISSLVSGGKMKAPVHRVLAPTSAQRIGSGRTSSVFFLRPKSDFSVSIPLAKACGFSISLKGEEAPFKDWIGGNYINLQTHNA